MRLYDKYQYMLYSKSDQITPFPLNAVRRVRREQVSFHLRSPPPTVSRASPGAGNMACFCFIMVLALGGHVWQRVMSALPHRISDISWLALSRARACCLARWLHGGLAFLPI